MEEQQTHEMKRVNELQEQQMQWRQRHLGLRTPLEQEEGTTMPKGLMVLVLC